MSKKSINILFALFTMGMMSGCYTNEIGEAQNEDQMVDDQSVIRVSGRIDQIDYSSNELTVNSIVGSSIIEDNGIWELKGLSGDVPQLIYVTNSNDEVIMMRRGLLTEGQTVTIDAKTTALAMITLHPLMAPITQDYDQLEKLVESQPQFNDLKEIVATTIANKRKLYDFSNDELTVVLSNILDNITKDPTEVIQTTRAELATRAMLSVNSYPLKVTTRNNQVIIRGTEMSPSYYGTVTGPSGSENIKVKTLGDYEAIYFLRDDHEMHEGEETIVKLKEQGDYHFHLSNRGIKGYSDLSAHILSNILDAFGAGKIKNYITKTAIEEMAPLINDLASKEFNLVEYGKVIIQSAYDCVADAFYYKESFTENLKDWWNDLKGADWAPLKSVIKFYKEAWDYYDKFTNSANAAARLTWWFNSPSEIDFCVCYNELKDEIESCTEVKLTMVSGNEQEGEAKQRLLLPLVTHVETRTDQGVLMKGIYQKVRYTVVKGNGNMSTEIVGTDDEASAYWTLGEGEPGDIQEVKAEVIDMVTNEPISDPVIFTAKVKKSSDITVRLDWHKLSGDTDIDLHVIDPFGKEIYFENTYSYKSGGWLDRDDVYGPGPEHIYFEEAPAGTYQVKVHYYDSFSQAVTTYKVTVTALGETRTYSGSIAYHQMLHICDITIPSTRSGLLFESLEEQPYYFDYGIKKQKKN